MGASSAVDLTIARLALEGSVCCTLCGDSMGDALPSGCEIRILADVSDIRRGDIVLFLANDGRLVAHRVLSFSGDLLTTKGDANSMVDQPIQRDQVLGVIVGVRLRHRWVDIRRSSALARMASVVSTIHSARGRGRRLLRVIGRLTLALSPELKTTSR